MSDDLIKRLGDPSRDWPEFGHDRREAKNRIEELKVCRVADAITLLGEQRKLAKAVEALQDMVVVAEKEGWDKAITGRQMIIKAARAVLAELEGTK